MVPERGFEPLSREAADFESAMYTVPSLWHKVVVEVEIIVRYSLKVNNIWSIIATYGTFIAILLVIIHKN